VVIAAAQAPARAAAKSAPRDTFSDLSTWTLHNVVVTADGSLTLAPSELISDENGATTIRNHETLSANVWAKKLLQVPIPDAAAKPKSAQLYVFGSAKAITFNGTALKPGKAWLSTGWSEIDVPVELIKDGLNEVVLSGGGSLIIENCKHPNRSAKSRDAGKTWDFDHLGDDDFNDGEYLIRLCLERTPAKGWAMSPVISLSSMPSFNATITWKDPQPSRAGAEREYRLGTTPGAETGEWTNWRPLPSTLHELLRQAGKNPLGGVEIRHNQLAAVGEVAADKPFLQLRVRWIARAAPGAVLDSVSIVPTAVFTVVKVPDKGTVVLETFGPQFTTTSPVILRPSSPLAFEKPGPRLAEIRKKHNLDAAVSGAKDELNALARLRNHVRTLWDNGWEVSGGGYVAPWDVRQILTGQPHAECLTMCTHYSVTFAQFAQALGWNARPVVLDHHCVAEVWCDQFGKWVLMDTGNSKRDKYANFHITRDGVPLSCLDIHRVWLSGDVKGVTVHFGDGRTDSLANLKNYPVCQLENWRRFGVPRRNNLLTTPFPGELEQGWSQYFGDFYTWWEDPPEAGKPWPRWSREYSHQSSRDGDLYPTLNTTTIHPFADGEDGMLVHLDSYTPNFKTFQVRFAENQPWKDSPASFKVLLKAGDNVVYARAVNAFGRAGRESRLAVKK
jgi:hypothetical protein